MHFQFKVPLQFSHIRCERTFNGHEPLAIDLLVGWVLVVDLCLVELRAASIMNSFRDSGFRRVPKKPVIEKHSGNCTGEVSISISFDRVNQGNRN